MLSFDTNISHPIWKHTTQYGFHELFLNSPSIDQYYILTCDKSTNRCRMVIVNYFTCDKSVHWVEKSLSQISKSELWERLFLKCRIISMSSVSFKCLGNGWFPHPQVGAGIAVKRFLISLYSKVKSKSVETTTTWPPEMNIQDEWCFSMKQ